MFLGIVIIAFPITVIGANFSELWSEHQNDIKARKKLETYARMSQHVEGESLAEALSALGTLQEKIEEELWTVETLIKKAQSKFNRVEYILHTLPPATRDKLKPAPLEKRASRITIKDPRPRASMTGPDDRVPVELELGELLNDLLQAGVLASYKEFEALDRKLRNNWIMSVAHLRQLHDAHWELLELPDHVVTGLRSRIFLKRKQPPPKDPNLLHPSAAKRSARGKPS